MSTSLAYITQEPEPVLPLLSNQLLLDPQTQVQREVRANLQQEIRSISTEITDPALSEISHIILRQMLRFFDWLARI